MSLPILLPLDVFYHDGFYPQTANLTSVALLIVPRTETTTQSLRVSWKDSDISFA